MNKPLISVIIPVFNGEMFLQQAIDNIRNQDYLPIEIIVVDDGSTDGSAIIAKNNVHVKYVYQKNNGPAAARNKGLSIASGKFVAFLDCDDLWADGMLSVLSEYLMNHAKADIAEGLLQELNWDKNKEAFIKGQAPFYVCILGCSLFRKSVFKQIGAFTEQLIYGEDIDWYTRAWEQNIAKHRLDQVTLFHRKHENNMTNNTEAWVHYRLLLYKLKIERRSESRQPAEGLLMDYLGKRDILK